VVSSYCPEHFLGALPECCSQHTHVRIEPNERAPLTNDAIRRFNRDTWCLATGVLCTFVFAALVLAVLVQDRYSEAGDLTAARLAERGFSPSVSSAARFAFADINGKSSEITSDRTSSVDETHTEISPQEERSSEIESGAPILTPVLGLTPEISHTIAPQNIGSSTEIQPDSARVIRPKIHNARSRLSVALRSVDVKRRLIALWHQSLTRSESGKDRSAFKGTENGYMTVKVEIQGRWLHELP
jgi:hypothetical protein